MSRENQRALSGTDDLPMMVGRINHVLEQQHGQPAREIYLALLARVPSAPEVIAPHVLWQWCHVASDSRRHHQPPREHTWPP